MRLSDTIQRNSAYTPLRREAREQPGEVRRKLFLLFPRLGEL